MASLTPHDRFRSVSDYARFVLRHQTTANRAFLIADAALLTSGVLGAFLLSPTTAVLVAWPAVRGLYGSIKLTRTLNHLRHSGHVHALRTSAFTVQGRKVPTSLVQASDRQASLGFVRRQLGKDSILASSRVDTALQSKDWHLRPDLLHPRRVRKAILDNREFCLSVLTQRFSQSFGRQLFVNEPKFCLSSELDPGAEAASFHSGGYFVSFCTNEACTTTLPDETGRTDGQHGGPLFPVHFDGSGIPRLDDLEVAGVNNHVGISTLAITSDSYFVVWQQGQLNVQDPGKIVATGSGSADYSDVDVSSLRSSIVRAMHRELKEEALRHDTRLTKTEVHSTELLGFFRWLDRGGKPEFVGLTRLNVPLSFLVPDHREVDDVRLGKRKQKMANAFFVPSLGRLNEAIAGIRSYESRGGAVSLPLRVILTRLEELQGTQPAFLDKALYGT